MKISVVKTLYNISSLNCVNGALKYLRKQIRRTLTIYVNPTYYIALT